MTLLLVSFFAGILTIAAPCVLPLLPVIIGGSLAEDEPKHFKRWQRPLTIVVSLAVSVILFTLLLKASTSLLGIPQEVWQIVSGVIVILLGIVFIWPNVWDKFALKTRLHLGSNKFFGKSLGYKSFGRDVLIGLSLGPVFNSCSPTYLLVVATVLPVSITEGIVYLLAYAAGLALSLFAVAILGQSLVKKLGWLSKPSGIFRKVIGILFVVVGVAVILGLDKDFQAYVLEQGWYAPTSGIEESLR